MRNLTDHINTIDPTGNIKFTYEEEEDKENRTIFVRFSTDSARDVWRHTSHQQQSHIAEDGRW